MANSITHVKSLPIYGAKHTVMLEFRKSDGTTLAPTSIDTEVSKDGGTFADAWEEVTLIKEVGGATDSAYGYITLTAGEMGAGDVTLQVKSANCVTIGCNLQPERLAEIVGGTAQDGADDTITLANSDSAVDSIYAGMYIRISINTGSGQVRRIVAYEGATRIATVFPNWETNPAAGSTYEIGFPQSQAVNALMLDAAISSRSTLGGTAQTGDSYARLGAPAGASVSADIAAIAAAAATAEEVWANPTRTLTHPQTSLIGEPDVNNLECIIATTFEVTWSGLNIGATWTAVMFTAKKLLDGADTTALVQVLISNPGAGGDGLQRYMGLAGGGYVTNAALTVDQPGGAVTLLVEDDVTALLTKQKVYYDLKLMLADGSSSILADGTLDAVYTPTKTINL